MKATFTIRQLGIILGVAAVCVSTVRLSSAPAPAASVCGINVSITQPAWDVTRVHGVLAVRANVVSGCQLQSVVAAVPGQSIPLAFNSTDLYWQGNVPVSGLPFGDFTLTITATDVFATTGSASKALIHDEYPTIVVTAPAPDALSRGVTHVTASCTDDGGACVNFRLWIGDYHDPTFLATPEGATIDQDVGFPVGFGQPMTWLNFDAVDAAGQVGLTRVPVYVEPSPRLMETFRAAGLLLDESPSRALFTDDTGQVCLYDKSSGVTTILLGGQQYETFSGQLTSLGAIFLSQPLPAPAIDDWNVYEWRNGALLTLGKPTDSRSFHVAGDYATWFGIRTGSATQALYLRDHGAGSTIEVETQATDDGGGVWTNGDLVYRGPSDQIWRYRGGVKTAVGTVPPLPARILPMTDGVNVAYALETAGPTSTWLITSGGQIPLDPGSSAPAPGSLGFLTYRSYAVNNGWTAFTRSALDGSRNLWLRRPDGTQTQMTFYGDRVGIMALNGDGRVAFVHGDRTYVVAPGGAPVDVGSAWPRMFWRDGALFIIVGRSVMAEIASAVKATGDVDGDARADFTRYANGSWRTKTSASGYVSSTTVTLGADGGTPVPGDYDGDRRQDAAVYDSTTGAWKILTSSSNFTTAINVVWGGPLDRPVPGDYDADGRTDLAVYRPSTAHWSVLTSSSNYTSTIDADWGGGGYTPIPGQDFDGDRKADVAVYQESSGFWYVLKSSTNYTTAFSKAWGGVGYTLVPGDYDGDLKADLGVYQRATGSWFVLLSGANFTTALNKMWGGVGYLPVPADYDADGKIDLGVFQQSSGNWYSLLSGSNFTTTVSTSGWGTSSDRIVTSAIFVGGDDVRHAADFDGDSRADITVYDTTTGLWSSLTSTSAHTVAINRYFGGAGCTAVQGDYDGDGRADSGWYQASTGDWAIALSSTNFMTTLNQAVGGPAWIPEPGDYDGDGKTDFVVYNPTTGQWYGLKSSTNYTTTVNVTYGGPAYIPVSGDFDGDGKTDIGVYRQSTGDWSILLAAANYTTSLTSAVGGAAYVPVPGDYDGDGKTDFTVYNATTGLWYGLLSSTNYTTTVNVTWGGAGYTPVKGDYDGDGRTDLALYVPTTGNWYILLSVEHYTTALIRTLGGPAYLALPTYP